MDNEDSPGSEATWAHAAAVYVDAGIVVHGPDLGVLWANAKACDLLGMTLDELLGRGASDPAFQLLDTDGTTLPLERYPVVLAAQSPDQPLRDLEVGVVHPGHHGTRWARVTAFPLSAGGVLDRVVVTFVDITELREAQAERLRAQAAMQEAARLEGLAVLAGGIAHDFNNLLVGVLGSADALLDALDEPADRELLEVVQDSALRAADLTRQLMAYAGRAPLLKETVDPSEVVAELARLVKARFEGRAILKVTLGATPPVVADATQLRQVLLNLLLNAADAVEATGSIGQVHVTTGMVTRAREDDVGGQRYARIRVEDDGVGMDEETRSRVFEPYFTTKRQGHGLGLAAVLGLVRSHGGYIDVTSEEGRGTAFELGLPASPDAVTDSGRSASGRAGARTGRILVVDDESRVRAVLRHMLEREGHRVDELADGEGVIEHLRAVPAAAVFLDVMLPGLRGTEVLANLRSHDDQLPVVLMSGHVGAGDRLSLPADEPTFFLPKPFRLEGLRSVLAQISLRADPKAT